MSNIRYDSDGVRLHDGEREKFRINKKTGERVRNGYDFRYRDEDNKRVSIYAHTLDELREKEKRHNANLYYGIKERNSNSTLNDYYELKMKSCEGILKKNTISNYKDMYLSHIKPTLGKKKVTEITRQQIEMLYLSLYNKKDLRKSTISNVQSVLHSILQVSVSDGVRLFNPADGAMDALRYKRNNKISKGLSIEQTTALFNFLKNSEYKRWYQILLFAFETGVRGGELCALQKEDINLEERYVQIDKTIAPYREELGNGKYKMHIEIHKPKKDASIRRIPLTDGAIKAIKLEIENQKKMNLTCKSSITGYFTKEYYDYDKDEDMYTTKYGGKREVVFNDFLFLNILGQAYQEGTINRALHRIEKECNKKAGQKILPNLTSHKCRKTYATRLEEAELSEKQKHLLLGHLDDDVTNGIYVSKTDTTINNGIMRYKKYMKKFKIY